jgi:hypothetical protein
MSSSWKCQCGLINPANEQVCRRCKTSKASGVVVPVPVQQEVSLQASEPKDISKSSRISSNLNYKRLGIYSSLLLILLSIPTFYYLHNRFDASIAITVLKKGYMFSGEQDTQVYDASVTPQAMPFQSFTSEPFQRYLQDNGLISVAPDKEGNTKVTVLPKAVSNGWKEEIPGLWIYPFGKREIVDVKILETRGNYVTTEVIWKWDLTPTGTAYINDQENSYISDKQPYKAVVRFERTEKGWKIVEGADGKELISAILNSSSKQQLQSEKTISTSLSDKSPSGYNKLTYSSSYYDVIRAMGQPDFEETIGPPNAVIANTAMYYKKYNCVVFIIYANNSDLDKSKTKYIGTKSLSPEMILHVAKEEYRELLKNYYFTK